MGQAPLFGFAVHQTADKEKAFPKGAHIEPHRPGLVRFPQLTHTPTHEHERQAPSLVRLHMIERTPGTVQERGKIQIVRDYGW
jgi:hypothetical protein